MNNKNIYKITYNMIAGANTNVQNTNVQKTKINVIIFSYTKPSKTVSIQLDKSIYKGGALKEYIITSISNDESSIMTKEEAKVEKWHLLNTNGINITVGQYVDSDIEIIDKSTFKLIPKLLAGPGPA